MGLFFVVVFFKDFTCQQATHWSAAPHTQCSVQTPTLITVPHPALTGPPALQILSWLRASQCWTLAAQTIYFINWYALSVAKLKWVGLERNFCYKKAWPQLLQKTDAWEEKWGTRIQRSTQNLSRHHLFSWWSCWVVFKEQFPMMMINLKKKISSSWDTVLQVLQVHCSFLFLLFCFFGQGTNQFKPRCAFISSEQPRKPIFLQKCLFKMRTVKAQRENQVCVNQLCKEPC